MSFFYGTYCAQHITSGGCNQSNCTYCAIGIQTGTYLFSTLKSSSFRALVLLYCRIDTSIRTKSNTDECGKFITSRIHNFVTFSHVMPLVYKYSDRSLTRPFNQATATQTVITLSCKCYSTSLQNRENPQIQQDGNSTAVQV